MFNYLLKLVFQKVCRKDCLFNSHRLFLQRKQPSSGAVFVFSNVQLSDKTELSCKVSKHLDSELKRNVSTIDINYI